MHGDPRKDERRGDPAPGTYGEVRRQLAEMGNPWTVDPMISDDEPLPDYPLGGMPDVVDEMVVAARLDPDADHRALIAEIPPNDPGLRERWIKEGMPVDRVPEVLTSDRPYEPRAESSSDEDAMSGDES